MTAEEFINQYWPDGFPSYFDNIGIQDMMCQFAELKCKEAIRNTRYKAIEIYLEQHEDEQGVTRDIQNIHNQDVLPELI